MRFEGTKSYVATDDLKVAVNAAALLRRPLLVKGEPGTGKTVLAEEVAKAFSSVAAYHRLGPRIWHRDAGQKIIFYTQQRFTARTFVALGR